MACSKVNVTSFTHKTTGGFEFPLAQLYAVSSVADGEVAAARLPVNTKTSAMVQLWPLLSYPHKNDNDTEAIFQLSSDLWCRRPQK
jgi:hypothetical protein